MEPKTSGTKTGRSADRTPAAGTTESGNRPAQRLDRAPERHLAREKAYVQRIERRFLALRESGLILSTRDFEILQDWFERGIPAELVIATLEETFARTADRSEGRRIQSIAYCRKAVERAWEERRAALLGTASPAPARRPAEGTAFTPDEIAGHLGAVAERTRAAAAALTGLAEPRRPAAPDDSGGATPADVPSGAGGAPDAAAERAKAALGQIADRLASLAAASSGRSAGELPALEAELVLLEERAVAAGRDVLAATEMDALAAEAAQHLAPVTSRMSARARDAMLRRTIEAAVRRRLGLPRYSLFTMMT